MGVFSTVLPVRTSFYFMNRNYFIIGSMYKNTLHLRREVHQIMKVVPFSVKPLTTLICRNSLINPVTNKFYFGILLRVANETGCESLIDQ